VFKILEAQAQLGTKPSARVSSPCTRAEVRDGRGLGRWKPGTVPAWDGRGYSSAVTISSYSIFTLHCLSVSEGLRCNGFQGISV